MQKEENRTSKILMRLWREHIRNYLSWLLLAIFFMIIVAACSAIVVKLVEPAVDKVFSSHDKAMLVILPLSMIAIYSLKGIAEYFQSYLIKWIGQRILTDLQIRMYEHLLFADIGFIQAQSSGRLISRFTNDISLMRGAVSNLLVGAAKHFLTILFLIILMFHVEPKLSFIVFIVFPLALYPIQKLGKTIRKISTDAQTELGHYTARLDETFSSIKVIKSFATENIEASRAKLIINNILGFYKKSAKFDALTSPIMEILSGIAIGAIIWYGGYLVIEGKTTTGALFAFITAFVSAYRPFKSLVALNVNLQEGIAATKRVFNILDMEPSIRDRSDAKMVTFNSPNILIKNLELKISTKIALKHINLEIKSGKTVAIVGASGSGKTSIANLLVRFFDPSKGHILIDNHDIKDITLSSLRAQIALVTQDTLLFDDTIAKNIGYGKANATIEEIILAAKFADAHEFISHLSEGYETIIGTQGFTLSGGQRQRLSIARAFLKDAPILILDEATSSLDSNSEAQILKSLKTLRQDKITIIITHRLPSVIWVDDIIVIKAGELIAQGTHEELLVDCNEYAKLTQVTN